MDREAFVYVDLDGAPHLMGRLWARVRKDNESATFEYARSWLEHPARFSLEPALAVGPGPFHHQTSHSDDLDQLGRQHSKAFGSA